MFSSLLAILIYSDMVKKILVRISAIGLCSLMLWSCGDKATSGNPRPGDKSGADRKEVLVNVADNIIIPSYEGFDEKKSVFVTKSKAFTDNPSVTTLSDFRQAWEDAYIAWEKVELFDVGPAAEHITRSYVNIYPVNVNQVTTNIAANGTANLELTNAYDAQGFPAFDYLINGLAANDADIVTLYTTDADASKRIVYVKQLTAQLNAKCTQVLEEWKSGFRDKFVNNTGTDVGSSFSKLTNGYVLNYERFIRSGKFGIPSGIMAGGKPNETKIEAFYKKDISKKLAQAAHQASVDFFNGKNFKDGTEGASFKSYLDALDAKDSKTGESLTKIINAQFSKANGKLALLSDNLRQQVLTNNQGMIDVFNEMQSAVRMLKVDMTSNMSIIITYVDNDGD